MRQRFILSSFTVYVLCLWQLMQAGSYKISNQHEAEFWDCQDGRYINKMATQSEPTSIMILMPSLVRNSGFLYSQKSEIIFLWVLLENAFNWQWLFLQEPSKWLAHSSSTGLDYFMPLTPCCSGEGKLIFIIPCIAILSSFIKTKMCNVVISWYTTLNKFLFV